MGNDGMIIINKKAPTLSNNVATCVDDLYDMIEELKTESKKLFKIRSWKSNRKIGNRKRY